MNSIYNTILSELISLMENRRENYLDNHTKLDESINYLLFTGDKHYNLYNRMVESNECSVVKRVEHIAVCLFSKVKKVDYNLYPIKNKYKNLNPSEQEKSRPFQIILKEDNQRVGIVFCIKSDIGKHYQHFINGEYEIDSLKLVEFCAPNDLGREAVFQSVNQYNSQSGLKIERIPILDFWEKYFGIDECNYLIDFFNSLNERAKEIIGFNTVVLPTEKALARFRETCAKTLKNVSLSFDNGCQLINQQDVLKHNYIDRQLWKAMTGKCNFAVSFITSEWFYSMYQLTENLDLTNVVTGYLKSIEQLLYAIIRLSIDTGITIRSKRRNIVEFTRDNEELVDTTLGALEQVLNYNNSLLDVNSYTKQALISIIDDWREKQRNGYFHKHNLYSLDKVNEIRATALQLYYLILGSLTINDEQFKELGIF